MDKENSFIGVGWSFPPSFSKKLRQVILVSEDKDIQQSLRIIINTSFGERLMRPEFGSNIHKIQFSALTPNVVGDLKGYIEQSILEFEPRVTLNEINIDTQNAFDGKLQIELVYTIRKINIRTNIVFPFYFKEGTNITT